MSVVVKGRHGVLEALHAGVSLRHIYVKQSLSKTGDMMELLALASQHRVRTSVVSDHEFKRLHQDAHTQGVVAEVDSPLYSGDLSRLFSQDPLPRIVLVLDHLEDPYNFGSLMRTCECLGVGSIVFPKDRQAPITPGVVQSSSGAIYYLDLYRVANVGQAILQLRDHGYWVYGTDVNTGIDIGSFTPQFPCAIVLGNEAKGQSKRVSDLTDMNVCIPMKGKIDSMNVSVSGAIILHHVSSQLDVT